MDGTFSKQLTAIENLKEILPSDNFKVVHQPYIDTNNVQKMNINLDNIEIQKKIDKINNLSLKELITSSKASSSKISENILSIIFFIVSIFILIASIYTYYYVQKRKKDFFDTNNLAINKIDINGNFNVPYTFVNEYIFAFPSNNNNDSITLPDLYDITGNTELLSTGNLIAIYCSFVNNGLPYRPPLNPKSFKIYKYVNDSKYKVLSEGSLVIFSVTRLNNVLNWIEIREFNS